MIRLPDGMGRFEFSVTASQRVWQLVRGCVPRVGGEHKPAMTALLEVAAGTVRALQEGDTCDDAAFAISRQITQTTHAEPLSEARAGHVCQLGEATGDMPTAGDVGASACPVCGQPKPLGPGV